MRAANPCYSIWAHIKKLLGQSRYQGTRRYGYQYVEPQFRLLYTTGLDKVADDDDERKKENRNIVKFRHKRGYIACGVADMSDLTIQHQERFL